MTDPKSPGGIDVVGSVETLFDIIEYVYRNGGVSLVDAASELSYAKSTIHRHLTTLERRGYIVQQDDHYYVGLRFLDLGVQARRRQRASRLAKEKVNEIATETDERAQFFVEEHGKAVYLHRSLGTNAVRTDAWPGKRMPLHVLAGGKALLAAMSPEKTSTIIEQIQFEEITPETISSRDELYAELEEIRERGFAFNRQEALNGLHAIGVPVRDPSGDVIGGLSVSGPSHRLTGEWFKEELPALLLGAANELELNIAHS